MQLFILNGPNLNLLGKRETDIYGKQSFEQYFLSLKEKFSPIELIYFQSNHEGELIDKIHEIGFEADGIILNAGALTHTSIALADAISAVNSPCIEVHISNIHKREQFRHQSKIASCCIGSISGFGLASYALALSFFIDYTQKSN